MPRVLEAERDCACPSDRESCTGHRAGTRPRQARRFVARCESAVKRSFGRCKLAGQELAFGPVQLQVEVSSCRRSTSSGRSAAPAAKYLSAEAYAVEALARLPAIRLSSASCSRSSLEVIKAAPRLSWLTMSKIASSRFSGGVCAASNLPIRRCASRALFLRNRNRRPPGHGRGRTGRRPAGARPVPDRTAGHRAAWTSLLRCPEDDRKRRDVGDVAETGQLLQRVLRFGRQAGELSDHEVHDVVGVSLGVNAVEIPGPARRIMIEGEHSLFGERRDKLNGEERIAAGLLVHQLRQRRGALRLAAKSVRDQLPEMLSGRAAQA